MESPKELPKGNRPSTDPDDNQVLATINDTLVEDYNKNAVGVMVTYTARSNNITTRRQEQMQLTEAVERCFVKRGITPSYKLVIPDIDDRQLYELAVEFDKSIPAETVKKAAADIDQVIAALKSKPVPPPPQRGA